MLPPTKEVFVVSSHPKIRWQMDKTPATVAFVTEAAVAFFTRDDISDEEKSRLRLAIERCVKGEESLDAPETVDGWLERTFVPKQYGMGALPPHGMEWQMGKTAATIAFVNEAEGSFLNKGMKPSQLELLQAYVERLKSGDEVLTEFLTFDGWLDKLRAVEREAWKAGKNAHVLAFVEEGEKSFATVVPIGHWADLRDRITALKEGKAALEEPQTVAQWLASLKGSH